MFNRRALLVVAVCAVLTSSTAFAGGGGTKKDATISVRNDTAGIIAAFVDPDPAKIVALPANPTQAQIEAAGGKLVNPNATVEFKVSAGTYNLAAGSNPLAPASVSVTIGKGQTKRYAFTRAGALVAY
jgi:hypothetical protein